MVFPIIALVPPSIARMISIKRLCSICLVAVLTLSGCDQSTTEMPVATYSYINKSIFKTSCISSSCHSSSSLAGGLNLEDKDSDLNLVNVKSQYDSTKMIILPFSPEQSYLLTVLENDFSSKNSDPHSQLSLSEEPINLIRTWIQQGAVVARLDSIQSQIFSIICVECHTRLQPAANLSLNNGNSYENLVNQKRKYDPEIRVIPGDTENSFLIQKLEGTELGGSRGSQMPLRQQALPREVISTIKEWINAGALNEEVN